MKIRKLVIYILVIFLAIGITSNMKAISVVHAESKLSNHPGLLTSSMNTSNKLHLNYVIFNGKDNNSIQNLNTNKSIDIKSNPLFNYPKLSTTERSSFFSPFDYFYFQHYVFKEHYPGNIFTSAVAGSKYYSAVYSENKKNKYIVSWKMTENVKPYSIAIKLPTNISSIESMIFQPSSNSILAFGNGKGYKINLDTGKIKQSFSALKDIKSLELSQNGKWLIVLTKDQKIQVLDTVHSFKDVSNLELKKYVSNNQINKVYFDKTNKHIFVQVHKSEQDESLSVINFPNFKVIEEISKIHKVEMNENRTILQVDDSGSSNFFSTEGFFSDFSLIRINPSNVNVENKNPVKLKVEGVKPDSTVVEIPLKDVTFSVAYDDPYGKYTFNQSKQLIPNEAGNAILISTFKGMKAFCPIKPTNDGMKFPIVLGEIPLNSKEVYGKTRPNSDVTITLTDPGAANKLIKTIKSNEEGFFYLKLNKPFAKKFEVLAQAKYRIEEGNSNPQELISYEVNKNNLTKSNGWKPLISNVKIDPITDSSPLVKGHTVPFATVNVKSKTKTFVGKADKYGNFILNIGKESIDKAGTNLKISFTKTGYLPSKAKSIRVVKDVTPPIVKWTQIGETMIGKTEPYTMVEIFNGPIRMKKMTSDRYGNIRISKVYFSPYNELFYSATDRNGNKTSFKFIQY